MLSPQLKAEAQKKLRQINAEFELDIKIKETIKNNTRLINDLINKYKQDPIALKKLFQLMSMQIGPKIIEMQKMSQLLQETQQQLKFQKEAINKQKISLIQEKQKVQLSVEEIKETITKIQATVNESVQIQSKRRQNIIDETQKSLKQIQAKIILFQKESEQLQKENQGLKIKKKQIQEKLGRLQTEFRKKAEQKDEQVKKEKQELMAKLQSLEGEVSQVTELNKQYSGKEKNNFDKKLSLYLKIKKFPEYSTSFQNSAKTIDQCKQELLKGVQRLNEATQTINKFQMQAKQLCNSFTSEFKRRDERELKIAKLKKQKQNMRDNIIYIQNKIKIQKKNMQDEV